MYSLRHLPEYVGTVAQWLVEPAKRNALMDIFLNRDYTQYDQLKGGTHKPDNWPLAEDFRLYVKRDVAPLIWTEALGTVQPVVTAVDPYAEGWRDVAAVQVFGAGAGAGEGQFQSPQGVAVGADGSIYVADSMNHRIQKFDSDGQFVSGFRRPDRGQLARPVQGTVGCGRRAGSIDLRGGHVESSGAAPQSRRRVDHAVGQGGQYRRAGHRR